MLASILLYGGLGIVGVGALSVLYPLRFLGIRKRRTGLALGIAGVAIVAVALAIPAGERRVEHPVSRLDEFMPEWQFDEHHAISVEAPPERVFAAIHAVTAGEISLFRTLTAFRRLGRPGPESILNAPGKLPILEVATRTGFIYLADEPPRELVIGAVLVAPRGARAPGGKLTPDLFRRKLRPGVALATMNFLVKPDDRGGSLVSTETRVYANSSSTARRFSVYWKVIHPGSDIIRRMWLRAVKRRAEGRTPAAA